MKAIGQWVEGDWIAAIAAIGLAIFLIGGMFIATRKTAEFAGHPRGLFVLFFAEMWERFSFYGMKALLIFYLTQHWDFNDAKGNVILATYAALVYITPVLGGYLADRYLGQRKAVLFGGVLLAIGHLLMAFEGVGGQDDPVINVFWAALSFIIVGSGFLKANISVIVGQLYSRTDIRRDGAYTIFYMGINAGAAFGTILVGYLGQTIGWSYGFGLAGIGMVLGLIAFVIYTPLLLGKGESSNPQLLGSQVFGIKLEWLLYLLSLVAVGVMWLLVQNQGVVDILFIVAGLMLLGYVVFQAFKLDREARDRIFAILFLISLQPLFWGLFEQAGGSLNLFTDRHVDRGGVPASLFQSINAIYIILLAPLFAWFWQMLARKGWEPSTPFKFGLALMQVGLGFLVLNWGAQAAGMSAAVPVIFIFLIYLLHTTGELCLSPVGLSAMNRLAPTTMASLIMGAWFYATAGGQIVAGKIGEATGGETGEATKEMTLAVYAQIGWVSIGVGVAVLIVAPLIKKLMHLDTLKDDEVGSHLTGTGAAEPDAAGAHPATNN
ncbi:peptide MFS transporter [Sphingorhabdus arenilitoris]|uniref:Peptide MFS transporter n=1 Tax=Sphingorhabdus arenilitoris TaxID=1490041 RepID=A0ABV8RG99_9SPHN